MPHEVSRDRSRNRGTDMLLRANRSVPILLVFLTWCVVRAKVCVMVHGITLAFIPLQVHPVIVACHLLFIT